MTVDTAAPALAASARNVMDRIRYMVLGTPYASDRMMEERHEGHD